MATRPLDTRTQRGFSLIEVLIASVILLVISLGMVPLFTRAIGSNRSGFDYTQVSNFARSRAEEFFQYPFNSAQLTIAAGNTERKVTDYFSSQNHDWEASLTSGDFALFTRTTTIRQFGVLDLKTPLDGGAPPAGVHLKEITVAITGQDVPLSTGKAITVRLLKSQ